MRIGRVYDDHGADRQPVLVDRLWPRGLRKDDPRIGTWCRDVAPSTELRHWYGHRPERYEEFTQRYRAELASDAGQAALQGLVAATQQPSILVTATKDVELSHLPVLAEVLAEQDAA